MPLLFSYGTLQLPAVQQATYGRLLEGRPDVLAGYRLAELIISNPRVVSASGKTVHSIARHSGDPDDRIMGLCFQVSEEELAASDRYEVDAYVRAEVQLESGLLAFVYAQSPAS